MPTNEERREQIEPTGGSTDPTRLEAGDDHAGPSRHVDPRARAAGHELDEVSVKGILIVPAIIVVGMAVAYLTVTILIAYFRSASTPDPMAHPAGVARNQAPLKERLDLISQPESKGGAGQPRLEGARILESGGGSEKLDLPYFRSRHSAETGNPPEVHPEELRPDAKRPNGTSRFPQLNVSQPEWVDQQNGVARISIDKAIELVPSMKALKTQPLTPAQQDMVRAQMNAVSLPGRPTASNSGRGIPGTSEVLIAPAPAEAKKDEGKKDEGKKDEGKKNDGKKEAPKKEGNKSAPEGKKE